MHCTLCWSSFFSSHDEARLAYTMYASSIGFNVRMVSTKVVDGIMVGHQMLCSKQRHQDASVGLIIGNKQKWRRVRDGRCGRPTMIYVMRRDICGAKYSLSWSE